MLAIWFEIKLLTTDFHLSIFTSTVLSCIDQILSSSDKWNELQVQIKQEWTQRPNEPGYRVENNLAVPFDF